MTNYMGKRRLFKIMLQMLSDRPELQAQIKEERDFAKYRTYRGSERLKVWMGDRRFEIYVSGAPGKVVSFEEYCINGYDEVMSQYNRILTKYNENFEPLPLATWFSGGCAKRRRGYYPFHDDKPSDIPIDDNLNPDLFVCYDIAKRKKA